MDDHEGLLPSEQRLNTIVQVVECVAVFSKDD